MHEYLFFCSPDRIDNNKLSLVDAEFKHCCRVLRHKVGDEIDVFDGTGTLYHAKIIKIGKHIASCKILKRSIVNKNKFTIHLAVGLVKSKALDLIVSQATSLGITSFTPLATEHSIKRKFNHARYQKKMLEAIKQSRQLTLPRINNIMSLSEWHNRYDITDLKLVGYQHADKSLPTFITGKTKSVALVIGPEGGFTNSELKSVKKVGFQAVNINKNRLRTELAVTATLSGIHILKGGK